MCRKREYFLPTSKIKDYNVIIDSRDFSDHSWKDGVKTYENIRKIPVDHYDVCASGYLFDCPYFKENFKSIAISRHLGLARVINDFII